MVAEGNRVGNMNELDHAEIERRIGLTAWQTGFPKDAVRFVLITMAGIKFDSSFKSEVDCKSYCCILHDSALLEFGQRARQQLSGWKIVRTADFGTIVYGLIENELMTESRGDSQHQFEDVFDFETAFTQPMLTQKYRRQWTLSTMFVATTVFAIAIFGFNNGGMNGIFFALISSWFVFLGVCCIVVSVLKKTRWLVILLGSWSLHFYGWPALFINLRRAVGQDC